jgi:hypothetical protein
MVALRELVREQAAVSAGAVIARAPGRDLRRRLRCRHSPTRAIEGEAHQHELEILMGAENTSCALRRPLSLPRDVRRASYAGTAAGPVSGQPTWRCGVLPVTLHGMRSGTEGRSRVALVRVHRARRRREEGPELPLTSATGETSGYPGARPVASSGAQSPAGSTSGWASTLVWAAKGPYGVAG